jgi:hypothetical protein
MGPVEQSGLARPSSLTILGLAMAGLQAFGIPIPFPRHWWLVGPRFGTAYPRHRSLLKEKPNTSKQPNAVSYCQATVKRYCRSLVLRLFLSIKPAIATFYMSDEPPLSPSSEAQASGPPLQVDPAVSIHTRQLIHC